MQAKPLAAAVGPLVDLSVRGVGRSVPVCPWGDGQRWHTP